MFYLIKQENRIVVLDVSNYKKLLENEVQHKHIDNSVNYYIDTNKAYERKMCYSGIVSIDIGLEVNIE